MYRIVLVIDEAFGKRVIGLAQEAYVWLVQSPENDPWARLVWQSPSTSEDPLSAGLSTFARGMGEPVDDLIIRLLEMIDEHHGELAHDPEWTEIEVIGAFPSPRVEEAARAYGVVELVTTPEGSCMVRVPPGSSGQ